MIEETTCRVCGCPGDVFWEDGCPTYLICGVCGAESGKDDIDEESIMRFLKEPKQETIILSLN